MALKTIEIQVEEDGDRNCPSCKDEDFEIGPPILVHARTQMILLCHCPHCGCDFRFTYTLFVDEVAIKVGNSYPL